MTATDRPQTTAHSLWQARRLLTDSDIEKVTIPKSAVPELPESFTRSVPANGLQNDGAKDSYRDDRVRDSLHLIEYDGHWRGHIDAHNPKKEPIEHARIDAPVATGFALLFGMLLLYSHWR